MPPFLIPFITAITSGAARVMWATTGGFAVFNVFNIFKKKSDDGGLRVGPVHPSGYYDKPAGLTVYEAGKLVLIGLGVFLTYKVVKEVVH